MKISIQNLQKKIPVSPKRIRKLVLKALRIEKIKKSGQLSFYFVNNAKIRKLNRRHAGADYATDVLSFDNSIRPAEICADIVISVDAARQNARLFDTAPDYEIDLYVIHGILHLFGYDDRTAVKKRVMQKRQNALLKALKTANP